jgi:acyl-CoA thioester hydrolase
MTGRTINEGYAEVHRGVVMPAHCDVLGHMNVRWYVHAFDDGGFHLWPVAGVSLAALREREIAFVVARIEVDYRRELRIGDLFVVEAAFRHVGGRSVRYEQRMHDVETGALCASQAAVEVCFDLAERRSRAIPDDVRATLLEAMPDIVSG